MESSLPSTTKRPWWDDAVGYQVYARSFADSNGDGVGDLWGVADHIDHIADLGVDFVWINPVYPSPGFDHGYDVADYTTIDEAFGGMAAFEAVRDALHDRGIRLLLDIVPGHTSHQHSWFQAALSGRKSPHRDRYVWRDPGPDGGPPNNWQSFFGGSAWEFDSSSGQYYFHRFLPQQPDLNWHNPVVHTAFEEILEMWFKRGVDGFRIDVAHGLLFDEDLRDNPPPSPTLKNGMTPDEDLVHIIDQPGTPDLYRSWRQVADRHDALLLGEVYLADSARVARYVADGRLHRAFWLPLQHTTWDRDEILDMLTTAVAAGGGRFAWPQSSHDDPRAATRFGGGEVGRRRALAFFHLIATLPGTPVMLAGDELGLDNGVVPAEDVEDPAAARGAEAIRDGSRTPMPWAPGPNLGFSTATPWLPLGANRTDADTVAVQASQPRSSLATMRHLLSVRPGLTTMLASGTVDWLDLGERLIALRRGDVQVVCNLGPATTVPLPNGGKIVAASSQDAQLDTRPDASVLELGADTTALVQVT